MSLTPLLIPDWLYLNCKQIEIAKGYDNNAWRDDLKKVLKKAGLEGKDTVFLFTDTQIVQVRIRIPLMTDSG